MTAETRTERSLSSASNEYVWDVAGEAGSHSYLLPVVTAELARVGARKVLDLGCGNGTLTARLQHEGYDMTGVDHSSSGIALARQQYPGIAFARHDLHDELPATHVSKYDAVVAVEVIEHLLLPRRLIAAATAALRPGGALIVTTPYHGYLKNLVLAVTNKFDDHWAPLRDYGHVKFFSRRTLTQLFGEYGYTSITFRTAGRVPVLAKSMVVTGIKPA
jgi:2-polyprenyl-6-hydroxyphenyl methylase/3-demethylubiquinone-9 3-methyltransferase